MEFRTERLILRPWEESDAESLYEYAKDPQVGPIAGWPVHTSVSNSREIIRNVLSAAETYAVCLKEDNRAIGSIGLIPPMQSHTKAAGDEMEIGYWIGVPFWGKGYIPEAVRRLLDHAFDDLGCQAVWCGYYDGNEKSRRVQEKCGFTYHHTEENKKCEIVGDVRTEHFTRLTKEQWKGLREGRKRRVRYKGTHPKSYEEKYKEHHPEKYKDTVERVIQKGSTPAGMHIPICVNEILEFLDIQPGQTGLDATLGYGGHTSRMLKCLQGQGHLYALDVDPIEIEKTRARLLSQGYGPEILTILQINFACVDQVAAEGGPFDFVLADLGVSSMQIDNPERGFSYKHEGPLDLRLNPEKGVSAAERLRTITQKELEGMLLENADEPYAAEISRAIISKRKKGVKLATTTQLREVIEEALGAVPGLGTGQERKEAVKKSCQRTFQALRIDVNNEFEVLEEFMEKLPAILAPGGRAAILTFHSGEDRLVKKSLKGFYKEGIYKEIAKDAIRPSAEECARNSRAKSAKMRWAIKA